jgi:hypothetical protein
MYQELKVVILLTISKKIARVGHIYNSIFARKSYGNAVYSNVFNKLSLVEAIA